MQITRAQRARIVGKSVLLKTTKISLPSKNFQTCSRAESLWSTLEHCSLSGNAEAPRGGPRRRRAGPGPQPHGPQQRGRARAEVGNPGRPCLEPRSPGQGGARGAPRLNVRPGVPRGHPASDFVAAEVIFRFAWATLVCQRPSRIRPAVWRGPRRVLQPVPLRLRDVAPSDSTAAVPRALPSTGTVVPQRWPRDVHRVRGAGVGRAAAPGPGRRWGQGRVVTHTRVSFPS